MQSSENFFKTSIGIDYLPARLTEGQEWYVSFYAKSPATGALRRKKIKLNRISGIKERRNMARRIIMEVNDKLSRGWNPFIDEAAPKSFHKFADVLQTYMDIQSKDLEPFSFKSYKSMAKRMIEYLQEMGFDIDTMLMYQFDNGIAADIMLRIKRDPKLSARTYNNYLIFFKALFNWMKSYNYVAKNPFESIKKLPKKLAASTPKELFTKDMLAELRKYLLKENPRYFAMCMICYFCFVRPNEISHLKLSDINLDTQTIRIRADHAKNDCYSIRTIPNVMMPYLVSLDWIGDPDYYVFSDDVTSAFIPGKKHLDPMKISKYWKKVRRYFGWSVEIQFYNLKHTGVTNMIDDGIALNFVQGQADHHSLEMTSIYAATHTPRSQEEIRNNVSSF